MLGRHCTALQLHAAQSRSLLSAVLATVQSGPVCTQLQRENDLCRVSAAFLTGLLRLSCSFTLIMPHCASVGGYIQTRRDMACSCVCC